MRCELPATLEFIGRGWNVVCGMQSQRKSSKQCCRIYEKLNFTRTRCVRRIRGLPSGDDISSVGATHCSINSLSERASDG